jgi:hypothetical protein
MDPKTLDYYKSNVHFLVAAYARARNPVIDYISHYLSHQPGTKVLDAGCCTGQPPKGGGPVLKGELAEALLGARQKNLECWKI